jgi:hypothetical protein
VVEPIHPGSNSIFDMSVAYLYLIILSVVVVTSPSIIRYFLTDFINLKIKRTQFFRDTHKSRV